MRLKIIAGNFVIVLVGGLIAFLVVRSQLSETLTRDVGAQMQSDAKLFERSWRLSALEFVGQVENRAAQESVSAALGSVGDTRRRRVFEVANKVADWFQDPARGRGGRPTIVAITDSAGVVVARNQDQNRLHGTLLAQAVPALAAALATGSSQHDVWRKGDEGKLLQVAIAPVRNDQGATVGALLVGYDLSAALAQSEARLLGRDVAFAESGALYSSSLGTAEVAALGGYLFGGPNRPRTDATLAGQQAAFTWAETLGDDDWVGTVGRLAMTSSVPVGYVLAANKTKAGQLASVANVIILLMALSLVLVVGYGFFLGSMFERPVEQIEEGVLAVINGNTQLRLDVESAEFGGLAYRINQLINVFTGVSEGDEGGAPGDSGGEWGASEFQGGVSNTPDQGPAAASAGAGASGGVIDDPALAARLGAEADAAYGARIFKEYVDAKTAAGESVTNLTQDRFLERLNRNAESLQKKHGVRLVRFVVEAQGGVVALKPVLIR